jgi:hypothetical protein
VPGRIPCRGGMPCKVGYRAAWDTSVCRSADCCSDSESFLRRSPSSAVAALLRRSVCSRRSSAACSFSFSSASSAVSTSVSALRWRCWSEAVNFRLLAASSALRESTSSCAFLCLRACSATAPCSAVHCSLSRAASSLASSNAHCAWSSRDLSVSFCRSTNASFPAVAALFSLSS